ncbi:MAG: cytochrome ubiquinol oxidase subunit I [Eubacterium sp.]|nr:cytochrome ubiquinol oxidase subunit I [Eubacterium sp.]
MRTLIIIFTAILAISAIVLSIVSIIIAVSNDSKGRGIKNGGLWTILTLLSPFIIGLVYYFQKDSLETEAAKVCVNCGADFNDNKYVCPNCRGTQYTFGDVPNKDVYLATAKKWARISVISFAVGVVMMAAVFVSAAVLPEAETETIESDAYHFAYVVNGVETYYDMIGNSYTDPNDVLYYDVFGNVYQYHKENGNFTCNGYEYFSFSSYVDENGYFVYDDNHKLTYDTDNGEWVDSDHNIYFNYFCASWNADGNLIDSFTGEPLFDSNIK